MKKIIIITIMIFAINAISFAGENLTINLIKGDVQVKSANGKKLPAKLNQQLTGVDEIITAANSEVELKLADGSIISVGPNQSRQVKQLIADNAINSTWVDNIWSQVQKFMVKSDQRSRASSVAAPRGDAKEEAASVPVKWKSSQNKKPSSDEIKRAIDVLKNISNKTTNADSLLEINYLIGECYNQIGKTADARKAYQDVINQSKNSNWGKKAQNKLNEMNK